MTRSADDQAFRALQRAMKRGLAGTPTYRWGVAGWIAVAAVPVLIAAAGVLVVLS